MKTADEMIRETMELKGESFMLFGWDDFDEAMTRIGYDPIYDKLDPFDFFNEQYVAIGAPIIYTIQEEDDCIDVGITLQFVDDEAKDTFKIAYACYRNGDPATAKEKLSNVYVTITDVELF